MSDITLILLSAGSSSRFDAPCKKQWLRVGSDPLWKYVTKKWEAFLPDVSIILTASPDDLPLMRKEGCAPLLVRGGATRQESLARALEHVTTPYVMTSDIARPCIDATLIGRLIAARGTADCIIPVLHVNDTVLLDGEAIDRDAVRLVQTPQLSRTDRLAAALSGATTFTDDSTAVRAAGGTVAYIDGDAAMHKLTRTGDLSLLGCLPPPDRDSFTGTGFDIHPFEEGKPMKLGGVAIDAPYGFKAHSDGDVAIHALIDALLGAAGMGDIGEFFPDTDPAYKGVDSLLLLKHCIATLRGIGYEPVHADLSIIAQKPRLLPYKETMRDTLAAALGIPRTRMNVKATTAEKLGFVGREEGIAVMASATLRYFNWSTL